MSRGVFFLQRMRARGRRLRQGWQLFRRHPLGLIGMALIGLFALMVILHPILMRSVWPRSVYHPIIGYDLSLAPHPSPPGRAHLLGTDSFGRDVLSQLLFGARVSFTVGLTTAAVAVSLSTLAGGIAGYFSGWADTVLMAVADVFVLLPAPIVLLIFGLVVRMDWQWMALLYALLAGLGGQAIVVKSYALSFRLKPYVEAARISGGGNWYIFRVHVLPALMPLALVHAVFTVVGAVLTESLLSFFGRTTVEMSWGTMIWLGQLTFRHFTMEGQWHAIAPPAVALMLFGSAFYMVGRALDEIANPRLRKR